METVTAFQQDMNSEKIKLFVNGRKGLLRRMECAVKGAEGIIWFHVASLGEFEEARPVIDRTRERFPEAKILLTFFSPSGYEPRKNYRSADWVFYLPLDFPRTVSRFLDIVRPRKAIFTIGEHWFFLMRELRRRGIDTYIMSVRIEPDSPYLKWFGFPYRNMFRKSYSCVMVQNERSRDIFMEMGVPRVERVGDARIDSVMEVSGEEWHDKIVEEWCDGEKVFVSGSNCPGGDDDLVIAMAKAHPDDRFLVIPHEMDPGPIQRMLSEVPASALYSTFEENGYSGLDKVKFLIVDKVGMLSRLYRYGFAALVGGGFEIMPHSVVEPAVYGIPVLVGPKYEREVHVKNLIALGAASSVSTPGEALEWYDRMHRDPVWLCESGKRARGYCLQSSGATERIMEIIFGGE